MMHFFRRSKIHLDCFTYRKDVIEYAPIVPAMDVIPDWWKQLPKQLTVQGDFFPSPTMKTCAGFQDYYNKSIAMPLWSELYISTENGGCAWQFSDRSTEVQPHAEKQFAGFTGTNGYTHLKIVSPWAFKTKADISWMFTEPIYNRENFADYIVPIGLLNFSKQMGTNIQLFVNTTKDHTFTIPFRSPILLTPLSDKKVVIHRQLVSKEKHISITSEANSITFINKYIHSQRVTKCPYKDLIK